MGWTKTWIDWWRDIWRDTQKYRLKDIHTERYVENVFSEEIKTTGNEVGSSYHDVKMCHNMATTALYCEGTCQLDTWNWATS